VNAPRQGSVRYLLAGRFYTMAWTEWGDPSAEPLVCVHGLTRNGRDFDALAQALSDRYRVICPDLPGRGASDWLQDPMLYSPPSYVTALAHLFAMLDRPIAYVGTSLGGICGMLIAACQGQPITRMVLNDIGPHIPRAALARIRDYIGATPSARSPRRNGSIWPPTPNAHCPQAASRCITTPASPRRSRPANRRTPIFGRSGTPSPSPCWSCAVRAAICCSRRRRR
jgi:pimeloyl-ACP methyl ester carboxylesterase